MSTGQVQVGVHVFEVMLEDFPKRNLTLTYADGTTEAREASLNMTSSSLCKVKVQFALEGRWFKLYELLKVFNMVWSIVFYTMRRTWQETGWALVWHRFGILLILLCFSPPCYTLLPVRTCAARVLVYDSHARPGPLRHSGRNLPSLRPSTGSPFKVGLSSSDHKQILRYTHHQTWYIRNTLGIKNTLGYFFMFLSQSIHDFQVSGPTNMTKKFMDEQNGKARITLSWTPHMEDLHRLVPVCFTAETNETWAIHIFNRT